MVKKKEVEIVGTKQVGVRMSEKSDIFYIIELPSSTRSKIVRLFYNITKARDYVLIYNDKLAR